MPPQMVNEAGIPMANVLPQEIVARMVLMLRPIPRRFAEQAEHNGMGDAQKYLQRAVHEVRQYHAMLDAGSEATSRTMPSPPWLKLLEAVRPPGPGDPFDPEYWEGPEKVPALVAQAETDLRAYEAELAAMYHADHPGPGGSIIVNAGAPFIFEAMLKTVANTLGRALGLLRTANVDKLLRGRRIFVFPQGADLPGGGPPMDNKILVLTGSYYAHVPEKAYVAYGRYVLGSRDIAIVYRGAQYADAMLHTLVHELGHAYWHEVLREGDRRRFHEFFSLASGHITAYAATKAEEDFAESWAFLFLKQRSGEAASFTHDPDAIERFRAFIRTSGRGGFVMPEHVEEDVPLIFVAGDPGIPEGRTDDPFAGLDEETAAELRSAIEEWGNIDVKPYVAPAKRPPTPQDTKFFDAFWRRFGSKLVNEAKAKLAREWSHSKHKGVFLGVFSGTVPPVDWKPFLAPGESLYPLNAMLLKKKLPMDVSGLGRVTVTLSGEPQTGRVDEPFTWAPGAAPVLVYKIRWQLSEEEWDTLAPTMFEGKAVGTARHGAIAHRDLVLRHQGAFHSTHRNRIRQASTNAVRDIAPVQEELSRRLKNLVGRWLAGGNGAPDYERVRVESAKILATAYEQMREIGRRASGIDRHGPGVDPRLLREEEDWFRSAVREELRYWNVFMEEIHRDEVPTRERVFERIDAYVAATRFMYESARILGLPDNVLIYWQGPGPTASGQHRGQTLAADPHPGDICEGCDYLMERSPFTKTTLPAVPKDGSTACLTNCRHKLVVRVVANINETINRQRVLPSRATMVEELRRIKEEAHGSHRRQRAARIASRHANHSDIDIRRVANPFHGKPRPER